MGRRLLILSLVFVSGVPLLINGSPVAQDEVNQRTYVLPGGFDRDPDPHESTEQDKLLHATILWERLYHWVPGPKGIYLDHNLANDFPQFNDERTECTITLRKDARFNDNERFTDGKGRVLRAADVVFVFKRLALKRRDNMFYMIDGLIVGMDKYIQAAKSHEWNEVADTTPVEGVTAVDDLTVRLKFTRPFGMIAALLAHPCFSIVPPEAIDYGDDDLVHPDDVPTMSPWITDWTSGSLEPRASYFGRFWELPRVRGVDNEALKRVSEEAEEAGTSEVVAAMERGLVDFFPLLESGLETNKVVKNSETAAKYCQKVPSSELHYLAFNMQSGNCSGLTNEARNLRRAVMLALDREALADYVNERFDNVVDVARAPFPEACIDAYSREAAWSRDTVAAERALSASNFPDGIDPATSEPLTLRLLCTSTGFSSKMERLANESLKFLGIRIDRVPCVNGKELLERVAKKEWDLVLFGWRLDSPLVGDFLQLFHSRNIDKALHYANLAGYASEEFDELLEEYQRLPVDGGQDALLRDRATDLVERVTLDVPLIPLFWTGDYWLKSQRVKIPAMPNCCFNTLRYIKPIE